MKTSSLPVGPRQNTGKFTLVQAMALALALGLAWVALQSSHRWAGAIARARVRLDPSSDLQATVVTQGLDHPWALAFLPDGRMLVSLKPGRLAVLSASGQVQGELRGLPPVADEGQGGLLDISLDPDFPRQPWLYWTFSEPGSGSQQGLAGTAVARGRLLMGDTTSLPSLQNIEVIYRQTPKVRGSGHFGARLAWDPRGWLYVSLGERQQDQPAQPGHQHAQNLAVSLGKIVRLTRDGHPAPGNPDWPRPASGPAPLPEIWSLGHRNPQGLAWDARTGRLWATEHGPQGGDELNLIRHGANYGWPLVSYGCPYGSPVGEACRVAGGVHRLPMVEPLSTWVPVSIAPSGLAVYTAERFPQWQGHLFLGALAGEALWEVTVDGDKVVSRRPWLSKRFGRLRDVRQGPDGWLYVLTDGPDGRLLRVGPPQAGR